MDAIATIRNCFVLQSTKQFILSYFCGPKKPWTTGFSMINLPYSCVTGFSLQQRKNLVWLLLTGTPTAIWVKKMTISTQVSQECNKYFTSKVLWRQGRGENKLINKYKIVGRWEKDCKISLNWQVSRASTLWRSLHRGDKFPQDLPETLWTHWWAWSHGKNCHY